MQNAAMDGSRFAMVDVILVLALVIVHSTRHTVALINAPKLCRFVAHCRPTPDPLSRHHPCIIVPSTLSDDAFLPRRHDRGGFSLQRFTATWAGCEFGRQLMDTSGQQGMDHPQTPRPLDAETPVEAFDRWLTPNDIFFVRSHFGPPAVELSAPWSVVIQGDVRNTQTITSSALEKWPQVTLPAVLQCSGNGRAFFEPKIPGVGWQWGQSATRNGRGVPARGTAQGHRREARSAARSFPRGRRAPFAEDAAISTEHPDRASVGPFDTSRHQDERRSHSGPPRRAGAADRPRLDRQPLDEVVAGDHCVEGRGSLGFYMQTGYRIPKTPTLPDVVLKPADLLPVTSLNVKSLIARPSRNSTIGRGPSQIRGVACDGGRASGPGGSSSRTRGLAGGEIGGADHVGSCAPLVARLECRSARPLRDPLLCHLIPRARRSRKRHLGTRVAISGMGSTSSPARSVDMVPRLAKPVVASTILALVAISAIAVRGDSGGSSLRIDAAEFSQARRRRSRVPAGGFEACMHPTRELLDLPLAGADRFTEVDVPAMEGRSGKDDRLGITRSER